MFSPTAYNGASGYRDQVEFRYAPSTWSDTESIDRGIGSMRINGDEEDEVFAANGEGREKSCDDYNETTDNILGRILGRREDVAEQMKRSQPYMMALLVGKSPTLRLPLGSVGQTSGINGREPLDSDRGDRYSPFTGDGRRPSQQYNRIGVKQPVAAAGKVFSSATAMSSAPRATWVTGPLQKEPPKEFVPQLLDPEPAYQKPSPDAIPGRKPVYSMQEDDAFKVSKVLSVHVKGAWALLSD
ncbi:unnamed protein product [Hydatigera taeniaeformis]|uniref:LsmAD domain-containing protein n=1 Tax=Hydatigena taeniaeformis TaxID=6205 RepID=A0A0R3WPV6_HYDTA|nr:unnamed protein product [Hydatigera taeniaeformis]